MNINQDPLSRSKSSQPPSPAERASMEATRNKVRQADATRRQHAERRIDATRQEAKQTQDRIEISASARRAAAAEASQSDRSEALERLRLEYKEGRLNTPERTRRAAETMLRAPSDED
ncbi:MAG: hypothetical protein P1V81_18275 [Planctomycetota bacterium]|nr:hypothetical protein [Planctomycetota bacterium]